MKAIPLYGNKGLTLKGFQLMLCPVKEVGKEDKKIILTFPDFFFDQLSFKYQSKLIRLDIKKIYIKETNDFDRYFIIACSSIRGEFILRPMFNIFETHYLLK